MLLFISPIAFHVRISLEIWEISWMLETRRIIAFLLTSRMIWKFFWFKKLHKFHGFRMTTYPGPWGKRCETRTEKFRVTPTCQEGLKLVCKPHQKQLDGRLIFQREFLPISHTSRWISQECKLFGIYLLLLSTSTLVKWNFAYNLRRILGWNWSSLSLVFI